MLYAESGRKEYCKAPEPWGKERVMGIETQDRRNPRRGKAADGRNRGEVLKVVEELGFSAWDRHNIRARGGKGGIGRRWNLVELSFCTIDKIPRTKNQLG